MRKKKTIDDKVFEPKWPDGLKMGDVYRFECDDATRGEERRSFDVCIGSDGDVYLSASDHQIMLDINNPYPIIRCRTGIGGGRHLRTRQALLWLAQAIRLDNEELERTG